MKIYSKIEPTKILHMVVRKKLTDGRTDVSDPSMFMQLATLKLKKGTTFRPHQHIWVDRGVKEMIAQVPPIKSTMEDSVKIKTLTLDALKVNLSSKLSLLRITKRYLVLHFFQKFLFSLSLIILGKYPKFYVNLFFLLFNNLLMNKRNSTGNPICNHQGT